MVTAAGDQCDQTRTTQPPADGETRMTEKFTQHSAHQPQPSPAQPQPSVQLSSDLVKLGFLPRRHRTPSLGGGGHRWRRVEEVVILGHSGPE